MVELNKKYQITVKKFGLINWIGFKSLWLKECNRFMVVWQQTLLSPLVSSLLFLSVLSLALGNNRGDVLGFSFGSFLIAIISIIVVSLIVEISITNLFYIFIFGFLSAFILGSLGFIAGMWAEKFDHTATVTNFIITPLSFLSGVFYSIDKLPNFFQAISHINPFFYMIDGFRYGFLGTSDGSVSIGLIYLTILSLIIWFVAFYLYKIGYKIKS